MKKLLAIILSIAMLFGVLAINTFAETTNDPKVTIITNQGSPVNEKDQTYFTVKFENFSPIKGIDVTITATGGTLGKVEVYGFDIETAEENVNYAKSGTTIRFVDLTGSKESGRIIVPITAPNANASITVKGEYAESGVTLFEGIATPENGTVEVKVNTEYILVPEDSIDTDGTLIIPDGKFVPNGAVYNDNGFIYKNENDGKFSVDTNCSYALFDKPANKITTFGASNKESDTKTLKFGNYSELNADNAEHGTMVFEGDWLDLINHYIKKGYTVQQLVEAIYESYDNAIENTNANYVYFKVGDSRVNVYKFEQTKSLYESGSILEYGINLSGVVAGEYYAAVAYSINNGEVTISQNVKSVVVETA